MPELLGDIHTYSSQNFPSTVGFTGIAVALLGRNHPVGMAVAALLWGLLDNTANSLDVAGVPKEIVAIMQGVIVLSVVVAYELVRRYRVRLEQRDVGRALGTVTAAPREGRHRGGAGMSAGLTIGAEAAAAPTRRKRIAPTTYLLVAVMAFLVLSAVRTLTGADRPDLVGHGGRGAHRGGADRAGRRCPGCGPSVPAWSTSASRA